MAKRQSYYFFHFLIVLPCKYVCSKLVYLSRFSYLVENNLVCQKQKWLISNGFNFQSLWTNMMTWNYKFAMYLNRNKNVIEYQCKRVHTLMLNFYFIYVLGFLLWSDLVWEVIWYVETPTKFASYNVPYNKLMFNHIYFTITVFRLQQIFVSPFNLTSVFLIWFVLEGR